MPKPLSHLSQWRKQHKYCKTQLSSSQTLNVMSKIVAMNYKWMKKEILCTEAMPFTITQISCYVSAGAEVMCRTGLPGDRNNKYTIGTTTVWTKERNMCSAACTASARARLSSYARQEDRVTTRLLEQRKFPAHTIWRHKLRAKHVPS